MYIYVENVIYGAFIKISLQSRSRLEILTLTAQSPALHGVRTAQVNSRQWEILKFLLSVENQYDVEETVWSNVHFCKVLFSAMMTAR